MTRYRVEGEEAERPRGINDCVVKGWRSRISTGKVGAPPALALGTRGRGAQTNMLIVAREGWPLGAEA